MNKFMDEIHFTFGPDCGTRVTLRKRIADADVSSDEDEVEQEEEA